MSGGGIDRATAWRLLGEPADQIGSLNDPRDRFEHGLRWNEKWIYRERGGMGSGRARRIVLWHRGDFVAVFRVGDDGSLAGDSDPFAGQIELGPRSQGQADD